MWHRAGISASVSVIPGPWSVILFQKSCSPVLLSVHLLEVDSLALDLVAGHNDGQARCDEEQVTDQQTNGSENEYVVHALRVAVRGAIVVGMRHLGNERGKNHVLRGTVPTEGWGKAGQGKGGAGEGSGGQRRRGRVGRNRFGPGEWVRACRERREEDMMNYCDC